MSIRRWHNIPGTLIVSGTYDEYGRVCTDGPDWSDALQSHLAALWRPTVQSGDEVEIEVEFTSSGYNSPATWDHPAEGDDERTLDDAQANLYRDGKIIGSGSLDLGIIDDALWEQIAAEDLQENDR